MRKSRRVGRFAGCHPALMGDNQRVSSSPDGAEAEGTLVRPLNEEDLAILALENDTVAGHTCKVILLDRPVTVEQVRDLLTARLHGAPELSMCLRDIDGAACWVSVPALDISAHVVESRASRPLDFPGLRAEVASIFAQRLDRARPLWGMDVVPELAAGGAALIWRIHHALADGSTAMRIAAGVLWDQSEAPAGRPEPGRAPAAAHEVGRGRMREHLRALGTAARELPKPGHHSPFDGRPGQRRSVAFAQVGLADLRKAASAVERATVNDAVLALVAGGVQRWLDGASRRLGSVRVKVPVSLHGSAGGHGDPHADAGNRDSFFCVDLPVDRSDPLERLALIRDATRARKEGHDAERIDELTRELGRASPRLRGFAERALAHPRSFALNVSNVIGPRAPVDVAGARVTGLYSVAEIRDRHALRIAVVSLDGTLGFGLCADPTLLPEVERLADGVRAEAAALTRRVMLV